MKDHTYHTFRIGGIQFSVKEFSDGRTYVESIHPYDETEYHWASKSPGRNHWRIIRNGYTISTVGAFIGGKSDETAEPLSPEQIAYFLIEADMKAHLEANACRN